MESRFFLITDYFSGKALECTVEETDDSIVNDVDDSGKRRYEYNVLSPADDDQLIRLVLANFGSDEKNELSLPLYSSEIEWTWWGLPFGSEYEDGRLEYVLEACVPSVPEPIEIGAPGTYRTPDSCDSQAIFRNSDGHLLLIDVHPDDEHIVFEHLKFIDDVQGSTSRAGRFVLAREQLEWSMPLLKRFLERTWQFRSSQP